MKANERLTEARKFEPIRYCDSDQLRHMQGTGVRWQFGLEAARVIPGHARAGVTQVYAEADVAQAAGVSAETG